MKTVLLAPLPPPYGGMASWTARVIKSNLKNGWTFGLVDESPIGRNVFGKSNRRKYMTEIKRCFKIWRCLVKEMKDPEVKIVHSCIPSFATSMMREYVCAEIAKKMGKKFIIHFRCTVPNTTKGKLGWWLLKKLCDKSDMIFVLNSQSAESVKKITNTPIKTIPNFVSKDELVSSRKINKELKTVLYVGGMIESKGVKNILEIAKRMPNINFRFVGEGDDFEKFARDNNINNAVFTGTKDKSGVKEELANADGFAFLSYFRGEGFSNALCEAMAAGLPCLVTDWAANADMVGVNGGAVVPVGDIDAAVCALNSMKSYEVRKKQSDANIQKVSNFYIDKVVLDMYADAYEEMQNE